MKIQFRLNHLVMIGLLAAAPAAAFAQQPADQRTYTGGRHHEDVAATAVPTSDKSISEKGVKKTEAPAAAVLPAGADRSISEKGVKKTEAVPAALTVAPPVEAGKGHSEKGIK